ncbi:KH domain protein [Apiospora phragmitis]|uniref:KH domain protein n=1 Tax=Apiospora phragmitis TaxID=2905665 RepID=A0ABR1SUF0_9PEZI
MATSDMNGEASTSAAERLLQQHADNPLHHVTVEDAPDEDLPSVPSKTASSIDTQSIEAFPELGAPKGKAPVNIAPIWSAKGGRSNGSTPANGTPRAPTPSSGVATPIGNVPNMSIPGRHVETVTIEPQFILPRNQLKRPIPDVVKDINRKSRADKAQQAIRDLVQQIGTRQTIKVPIPRSTRAHVIGKQGSTIKSIQERTGARIQMPKADDAADDDDDDTMVDVLVEGNTITAAAARDAINRITGERSSNISTKLKSIPAEFYPFIAGANNNSREALESDHGVQIRIPPHQPWAHPIPAIPSAGERPLFAPANNDNHIQLAGDRAAVAAARAAIERRAQELQNQLQMDQVDIARTRHQFIIGDRGIPMDDFFAETNCVILLPTDDSAEAVTVIGPDQDAVTRGLEKAMDLAMSISSSPMDVSRSHKHAAGGASTYLETSPVISDNLFARDAKNIIKAQKEVSSIVSGLPPSRLATVPVDPFFHAYLRSDIKPRVQSDYGVHLVVPEPGEATFPVLLVYEGETGSEPYQIPQKAPTAQELKTFQQGLQEARKHILDLIGKQEQLKAETLEVPTKFHEKLRNAGDIPVRVSVRGTTVTMRGPTSAVDSLASKSRAFVEQEKEDEKERGFTMKFDFPQKFANHLIGKGGSHINELREKFDVDIQVQNGEVELKGPKAKAERAKSQINSLARTWADETSHTLKVEPKFHRELIGAQGSQIGRLQTRYNVHINFPRTARAGKDDESGADAASETGKPKRQQGADEVVIRGPKKGADSARDEVWELYQFLKNNSFIDTVTVQQKQLPSLIGSGGSAMDELRSATGAKIDIPNERNEDENTLVDVQIKGTKTQVAAAKKLLEEKRAVFDDTVTKTIDVDRQWHKFLIGPGGATLRDIIVKAGGPDDRRLQARTIQFPKQDADGNSIKVEGRTDIVDKIVASIEAMVSERASQVSEVVDVPVEKHRTLIGRGGEAKRKIESEFKVSIDIPRQGSGQTGVKIVGKPDDEGETVQVPRKYHNAISDNGAFFRKLRNDHKVTVDHAGHSTPPKAKPSSARANNGPTPLITDDPEQAAEAHSWNIVDTASTEEGEVPWVLRGNPENVERVKKLIATALEQAQKNTATGYLVLPDPSTYRYVIGQGGSKVNAIRKQSGCRITVPRDQARDEAIEINGSREGCEVAKDLILEAVREGAASRQQRD